MGVLNFLTGTAGYTAILAAFGLAVAAHFFAPRAWSALAWTIAFGVLGAAFVGQREITAGVQVKLAQAESRIDKLVGDYAKAESDARQAALDAERRVTAREHDLQAQIDQLDKEARDAQLARDTARRAADRAADRLRTALDSLRAVGARDAPGAAAAAAGQCAPAERTLGVLAELHQRLDQRAGAVSEFADAAQAAGQQCEVMYEAARASLTGK